MDVPGELIRAARAALGIGQRELARRSGVGFRTLQRIELCEESPKIDTRRRLQGSLESMGVTFVTDDGSGGPGFRIRRDLLNQGNLRF